MLKKTLYTILIITSFALGGCASNAEISQMSYNAPQAKHLKNPSLNQNIVVGDVTGGHETSPLWTSQINDSNFKAALEESLNSSKLYNDDHAKYILSAQLIKLDQPMFGLDLNVKCLVHYKLKNQKTNKLIYDQDIQSSYTATFHDSPIAITRLKMANEGAAKANIQKLISNIYQLRQG